MKTLYSILTLSCLLCLFGSCNKQHQPKDRIRSVKIDTVKTNTDKSYLQYPGRVHAAQDVDLAFRVSGKIQRILVKEGQTVKAGQLLAVMDPSDYQVQLQATEAQYKQIKAEAERVIGLYNDGGSTANDYDKAVYGLKQIEALYQHHKDELSYTKLYAPFDGFVQKHYFKAYETVSAGLPVLSLLSQGAPEVEINIPAAEYIHRQYFGRYQCTFDVYPGEVYPLQLISIAQKANPNQLYKMRLQVDASHRPLPTAGMNTMVSIFYTEYDDHTMQVPSSALFYEQGQTYVYVYQSQQQTVARCRVECLRPLTDGHVIIQSDQLQPGQVIVSAGVHALRDGDKVSPLTPVSKTNIGGLL